MPDLSAGARIRGDTATLVGCVTSKGHGEFLREPRFRKQKITTRLQVGREVGPSTHGQELNAAGEMIKDWCSRR